NKPTTQAEVDSIKATIEKYPFYKGFIYSVDGQAHLMAVTFDQDKMNSKGRIATTEQIKDLALAFGQHSNTEVHFSGMPFIRTNFMSKVSKEVARFMGL